MPPADCPRMNGRGEPPSVLISRSKESRGDVRFMLVHGDEIARPVGEIKMRLGLLSL